MPRKDHPVPDTPLAIRLHRIRQQADNAIRRGERLDPRLIRDMTTGEKA